MKRLVTLGVFLLVFALPSTPVHAESPASTEKTAVDVMPYHYGKVVSQGLAVYQNPGDAAPVRWYTSAGTWVSIRANRVVDGQVWYLMDRGGWVPASAVEVGRLSDFHGVRVVPGMAMPFGFVVADPLNVRAQPGVANDNPPIGELQRYSIVSILDVKDIPDGTWYQIGENRWVSAQHVRRVAPVVRPKQIGPNERWIEVNLREQTLRAYEGPEMVYATLISSGLPRWQTITGLFRIWIKITARKMSGGSLEDGDYYYLADVPWTMYFKGGYGLHAAYWHDDFGRPKSHGCVNLSPLDAYWLFQWATPDLAPDQITLRSTTDNPGTWVFVHAGTQPEALDQYPAQHEWLTPATDVLAGRLPQSARPRGIQVLKVLME
ncbi:MAG: L,D-transpeptidase family protein [Anaerolineae bacterium]